MILHNRQKSLKFYHLNYMKEVGNTVTAKQMATLFGCHEATVKKFCKKMYIKPASEKYQPTDFKVPELTIF